MLILGFQIGSDRCGLPSAAIEEVISLVDLRNLPSAPASVVGDFNYHETMVPVIDLHRIALDRPSSRRWSTRILLTRVTFPEKAGKLVGLIAEHATELIDAGTMEPGPSRLLDLEEFLDEGTRRYLAAHEETPPPNLEYVAPPPELMEPATIESPAPSEVHIRRRRRKPRLAYLDPQ